MPQGVSRQRYNLAWRWQRNQGIGLENKDKDTWKGELNINSLIPNSRRKSQREKGKGRRKTKRLGQLWGKEVLAIARYLEVHLYVVLRAWTSAYVA